MILATRHALTDDMTDAAVIPFDGDAEVLFDKYRQRSMAIPGIMYPSGARNPMLPTIPNESASILWTTDITVAHPKIRSTYAATIRNIRENPVAIPPGI